MADTHKMIKQIIGKKNIRQTLQQFSRKGICIIEKEPIDGTNISEDSSTRKEKKLLYKNMEVHALLKSMV